MGSGSVLHLYFRIHTDTITLVTEHKNWLGNVLAICPITTMSSVFCTLLSLTYFQTNMVCCLLLRSCTSILHPSVPGSTTTLPPPLHFFTFAFISIPGHFETRFTSHFWLVYGGYKSLLYLYLKLWNGNSCRYVGR